MQYSNLGSRMKEYENVSKLYLTKRTPVIIRIDGRAFHSFTRGFEKPFDYHLMKTMWETARYLCENIEGCKIAYVQSDEISLLLNNYEKLETAAWFNNNIQKITSISASMSTLAFNNKFKETYDERHIKKIGKAMFDARVFTLPKEEVCNYFIWRQKDAIRNSIQMVGQANFSHRELQGKSCEDIKQMLKEININYDDFLTYEQRGVCIIKEQYEGANNSIRNRWVIDLGIPLFTEDRNYIEQHI